AALDQPAPCLIHASIDAEQKVYPMVPPGAANRDMMGAWHERHQPKRTTGARPRRPRNRRQ
ncbi:MAG: hypothetical protein E6R09_06910, partial [Rhodocyclaceae bacterium]